MRPFVGTIAFVDTKAFVGTTAFVDTIAFVDTNAFVDTTTFVDTIAFVDTNAFVDTVLAFPAFSVCSFTDYFALSSLIFNVTCFLPPAFLSARTFDGLPTYPLL